MHLSQVLDDEMTPLFEEPLKDSLLKGKVDERKSRLLIEIHGDVTSTQVAALRRSLADVIEASDLGHWKSLYFDMRSARMIDASGVNWIHAETIRLKELKKSMVLRISSPAINRVIRFAGLDKLALIKFRRRKQTR